MWARLSISLSLRILQCFLNTIKRVNPRSLIIITERNDRRWKSLPRNNETVLLRRSCLSPRISIGHRITTHDQTTRFFFLNEDLRSLVRFYRRWTQLEREKGSDRVTNTFFPSMACARNYLSATASQTNKRSIDRFVIYSKNLAFSKSRHRSSSKCIIIAWKIFF